MEGQQKFADRQQNDKVRKKIHCVQEEQTQLSSD